MATQTTNYGLTKPSYNETADIGVINSNMDIIDAKMKAIENKAGSGGGGGNTDTYGHVKVGSVTIDASGDDTIELVAGSNVTLTPDTTSKSVTISATGGGGTSVTIDSELSTTSENPVQNKVITQALNEKGTYSKPTGGIPKTDLASGVQTSLDKADNVPTIATKVDSISSTIANQNSYGYLGGNLLQFNNGIVYPFTNNGITFSKDNRSVITINGNTSSEYAYVDLMLINGTSGTYKISGIDLTGKGSMYVYCIDDASFPISIESGEGEITFDSTKQYLISLNVYPNTAVSNAKVYPMIRLVTDTDSTYRPYSKSNVDLTNEKANNDIISDAWNASTTYEVGQYCIYNNSLWKCLVQHNGQTPSEGTYWTKASITSELIALWNAINV